MRLIEERRASATISYVYEPNSYVPLARLDADGQQTEQGGLGTRQDPSEPLGVSKTIAASAYSAPAEGQNTLNSPPTASAPDDGLEAQYWAALSPGVSAVSAGPQQSTAAPKAASVPTPTLCEVYYFHTDQVGLPEELTNAQGHIVWQARHKTWGNTAQEHWQLRHIHGEPLHGHQGADTPQTPQHQQNLRLQGQYLDRETGLHYNTFRYYDADIGRFISPDPIGLEGGINLGSYSPNPFGWIDPLGLLNEGETAGYGSPKHRGDGLEAHEILRNKKVQEVGVGTGKRVKGNPSIALDPKQHDAVHAEENRLRRRMGLGPNEMLKSGKAEIRLMSKAIYNSLVKTGKISINQLRVARKMSAAWAKSKGCY